MEAGGDNIQMFLLDQCYLSAAPSPAAETVTLETFVLDCLNGLKSNHWLFTREPDPDPLNASSLGKCIKQNLQEFRFSQ